jgi:hypothetical protein
MDIAMHVEPIAILVATYDVSGNVYITFGRDIDPSISDVCHFVRRFVSHADIRAATGTKLDIGADPSAALYAEHSPPMLLRKSKSSERQRVCFDLFS